jgi:hypothetical protein
MKNQFTLKKNTNNPVDNYDFYKNKGAKPDESPVPNAVGGIFSRPHVGMLAEAGPEAYIPLNGSTRSESIWRTTGEKLGLSSSGGGDTFQITFAHVINGGSASEIMPQLEGQQQSFMEEFKAVLHQQRRVSFN